MSISGAALSAELVPGYIMRLNNEEVMRGKNFASLQMQLPKPEASKPEASKLAQRSIWNLICSLSEQARRVNDEAAMGKN